MKPKTKLQIEVWGLHQKLHDPKEHEPFVISNHNFYYTTHYKNLVCLECNHQWKPAQIWQEELIGVECPSCKNKLLKTDTHSGGIQTKIITYSVTQVVGRFQVFRYFSCWKHMHKNKLPRYSFHSLFEEWKDYEKNKSVIIGRTQGWTGDGFNSTDYEVRYINNSSWRGSPYEGFVSDINCPGAKFLPIFKKYGLAKYRHDCDYRFLIKKLKVSSRLETILKSRNKELLKYVLYKQSDYCSYWPQIKILLKNKYKLQDVGMWFDYIDLLKSFGKDIRNPKFILPQNLKKEHNIYVAKRAKKLEIERIARELRKQENERLKAEAAEALKNIKTTAFKDLKIHKGDIKIITLLEEEDVKQEGKILKHCVYTNEYHKKSGILLLSARINDRPIETIELSLLSFKIIQARGYDNDPSPYHDEIINILNKNMRKISKIVEKHKMLKEVDSNLRKLENVA